MRKLLFCIIIGILFLGISTPSYAQSGDILWTEEELKFIEADPVIRLGIDPTFVPFEFMDTDGKYKGIAADYIKLLRQKTGLRMEVIEGMTWPQTYDKALAGEIDVLPAVSMTSEREQDFLFSKPYYYFKRVIVTRDTNSSISGIEDLNETTVAVQKNSSHHSYLLSYPRINLSLYETVEKALTAVANGTETAFVGNLATNNYLIRSTGLTNLKFVAFEAEKQLALHFAVRKDWPVLVSIINKALATVTEEERISINNKWIDLKTELDYKSIIRMILIIGSIILVVLLVSAYWIIRLRKEIEKRKLIQVDLEKAKQEAEDANNIKSRFMARMSHEIRTPLNAITGMAYLLKKTDITLAQRMYVDRITQASNNMLGIINDILDFSKIEAGKVELEVISFSLDKLIQNVVSIVSYRIEEQRISFKLQKDPSIPNWFFGDAKRIEQILLNIVNNAIKFTSSGEISLDIRCVAKESTKYHLAFFINDTGIGMSPQQVQQLFEPFTQGDASINRRFGGTGLGLSIVKNLVELMDGKIQVYSTEGEGSSFVIHLSLEVDAEKEAKYKQEVSSTYIHDLKTLVLEKSTASMNIIDSYLAAFGMSFELIKSDDSALKMLETANKNSSQPYELLIMDYDTPSKEGFEFLLSLRQNRKIVRKPKVIMLLPMMREDLFDKLDEYGADIGIAKPIIPSILFNSIIDIFKSKAEVDQQALEKVVDNETQPNDFYQNHYDILVVEDNLTNQLIARTLLEQAGFNVWLADDGKEGVRIFMQHQESIDLILMDLHMPEMNGYEAAVQIRNISEHIPIVAMTADVIQGVTEKCEEHGIHHYISKPLDPELFIKTITQILYACIGSVNEESSILDRSNNMKLFGGNYQLYEKVLAQYYNENQETAEQLNIAIDENRFAEAIQIVHKLKGSTGSIGAKHLYKVARKLQKALEDENETEIRQLLPVFNQSLRELLKTIKASVKEINDSE